MKQDDGSGIGQHSEPEHGQWCDEECVERADGDQVMAHDAATRVEQQHHETFTVRSKVRCADDMEPPVIGGDLRVVTQLHVVR